MTSGAGRAPSPGLHPRRLRSPPGTWKAGSLVLLEGPVTSAFPSPEEGGRGGPGVLPLSPRKLALTSPSYSRSLALEQNREADRGTCSGVVCRPLPGVDPDDTYNETPYEKGFCFVSYLAHLVGDLDKFDKFLKVLSTPRLGEGRREASVELETRAGAVRGRRRRPKEWAALPWEPVPLRWTCPLTGLCR